MSVITAAGLMGSTIPAIQIGVSRDLAYNASGGVNTQSAAFGGDTTLIEVAARITGNGVRIAIGASPNAADGQTHTLLPASGSWFFVVSPGWKIAAISDDATTGFINITEAVSWG